MFGFLAALFTLALAWFGGVEPHVYTLVDILWFAGIVGLLVVQLYRSRRLDYRVLLFCAGAVLIHLVSIKLAVGAMAAGWAWLASERSFSSTARFLRFLLILGVLEALLGLIQYFLAPGWIFSYHNPYYVSSGTLINRNHFAGLLDMLIPIALGCAYTAFHFSDKAKAYVYLLAGAFMAVALIFSTSRMGIFSFVMTALFLAIVLWLRDQQRKAAAGLALVLLSMVLGLALWVGIDVIVERYASLANEDALFLDGRAVVFSNTATMIAEHPWGVGAGKYIDMFRRYQTFRPELVIDHAHNDYLETAAEFGLLPAALFWSAIFFVFGRTFRGLMRERSPEKAGILLACLGAMFSIVLHSLMDFNLQIPSNAMLFFTFVGIACGLQSRKNFHAREAQMTVGRPHARDPVLLNFRRDFAQKMSAEPRSGDIALPQAPAWGLSFDDS